MSYLSISLIEYARLLDVVDSVEAMDHARDCQYVDGLPPKAATRLRCNCAKETAQAYREEVDL